MHISDTVKNRIHLIIRIDESVSDLIELIMRKRIHMESVYIESTYAGTFKAVLVDVLRRYYKLAVFRAVVSGLAKCSDRNNVYVSQITKIK